MTLTPEEQLEIFGTDKVGGEWADEAERRWGEADLYQESRRALPRDVRLRTTRPGGLYERGHHRERRPTGAYWVKVRRKFEPPLICPVFTSTLDELSTQLTRKSCGTEASGCPST